MAQDRLIQNEDGSVTLVYANGARQTVPASNRAGLLQLAERVPAEQIDAPVLERIRKIDPKFQAAQPSIPQSSQITDAMRKQAEKDPYYAAQLQDPALFNLLVNDPDQAYQLRLQDRGNRITSIRTELENQYNNLVKLDPNAAYRGNAGDLPTVFNQQATQLADAGVTSITDLKIQNGTLINSATGKAVTNSNLGGQVAVDRDTGVQKWGDIFSGVQGGANYGIQALDDGSVVLFPAWEKSKSLTQQVLQSDLFKVGSLALAAYGLYNLGTTLASAGGAEAVTAAAGSGAGSGAGLLDTATLGGLESMGGGTGISAVASASPSLAAPIGVAAPGVGEGISLLTPAAGGAATIAGLQTPGLSSMGGAQGITVPVQGGTISEMVFVPAGATPALGDPSSFINNPDYLGSPVISEDYLALTGADMPSGMLDNALKALEYGGKLGGLLGGPQQQGLVGGGGGMVGGRPAGGVDYSELLKSLTRQASVPGVAPLIGPVVQPAPSLLSMQVQPVQYQSLLNQQSLLG